VGFFKNKLRRVGIQGTDVRWETKNAGQTILGDRRAGRVVYEFFKVYLLMSLRVSQVTVAIAICYACGNRNPVFAMKLDPVSVPGAGQALLALASLGTDSTLYG